LVTKLPRLIQLSDSKNRAFSFDIREFYADGRVDGDMWNTKYFIYRVIYNFFKKKEDEEVRYSDGMVCLTFAAERIIQQWPHYKEEVPLEVIPCSVDMDLFDPQKIEIGLKTKFKIDLGIKENDFIITYLGSIGGWYLTEEMMQFCRILSDKISAVKFLFISAHQHDIILKTAQKAGIAKEKIIVTHAQRNDVPVLLSLSNYSIFFIKPCYSKLSSSPTKHAEIMAMGIPVITNAGIGDVAGIIEKYKSGIVLSKLNETEFLQAAESISKGISFDNNKIRNAAKEFYDLQKAIFKYQKIYKEILWDK
jgi:glycosyltransferase involved in cell wall biosynthesis